MLFSLIALIYWCLFLRSDLICTLNRILSKCNKRDWDLSSLRDRVKLWTDSIFTLITCSIYLLPLAIDILCPKLLTRTKIARITGDRDDCVTNMRHNLRATFRNTNVTGVSHFINMAMSEPRTGVMQIGKFTEDLMHA